MLKNSTCPLCRNKIGEGVDDDDDEKEEEADKSSKEMIFNADKWESEQILKISKNVLGDFDAEGQTLYQVVQMMGQVALHGQPNDEPNDAISADHIKTLYGEAFYTKLKNEAYELEVRERAEEDVWAENMETGHWEFQAPVKKVVRST